MLPRINRLPLRTELSRLKNNGRSCHSPLFTLIYLFDLQDSPPPRFAFIVSARVARLAVQRNKIKRRLSAALLPLLPDLKPGFCGVLLAKHRLLEADLKTISLQIDQVLTRSACLKSS